MKKWLSLVAVAVFTVLMVSTAGAQDDPLADIDPTGVEILYWHEWDGAQGEGINAIIDAFNAENEFGITVVTEELGSSGNILERVSAGITSGELPNLAGNGFVNNAMTWYLDGVVVPLDDYINSPTYGFSEEEAANINMDVLSINQPQVAPFNGQLLAWPIGISSNVVSTNIDMLAELSESGAISFEGIPQTPEQLREAACAASELEGVNGGYAARPSSTELYDFIYAFGGFIFDEEADQWNITNENAITAMQFAQDLYNDGCMYFPDGGFFANTGEFSLRLNAFAPGSSVGVPFIQGDLDEAVETGQLEEPFMWVNTPFPSIEGVPTTLQTFLRGVVMFESTPEENLATWLFLKYWATSEFAQVTWTESAQYQPYNTATPDLVSDEFLAANPQYSSFADALASDDIVLTAAPSIPRANEINDIASALYSDITIGGADVMEAAAEAQEEMNELYAEILEDLADAE